MGKKSFSWLVYPKSVKDTESKVQTEKNSFKNNRFWLLFYHYNT